MNNFSNILEFLVTNTNLCTALTSIFTVLLSGIAILISILNLRSLQQFNKRSVKPFLSFDLVDLPNRIAIKLRNDGIGVAILHSSQFTNCTGGNNSETLLSAIEALDAKQIFSNPSRWKRYQQSYSQLAIAPNQEKFLIEIELNKNQNCEELEDLRCILKQISTTITYKDIYNQTYSLNENFQYFGRKGDDLVDI